ncbi:MAG: hypothetical protein AAF660_06660 [Pseudomonadota bacterium]
MLLTLNFIGLSYAACVAFFHSGGKRTELEWVRAHRLGRPGLQIAAWALIALSLAVSATSVGLEYAIPILIGVAGGAGIVSLLVATYWPGWHLRSGLALLVVGVVTTPIVAVAA